MEYVICFIGGAVFGAAFLFWGMQAGKNARVSDIAEKKTEAAEEAEMRRRQEKEAENLRKQFENMMSYTGEAQE